jgi:hypothetical protein
LHSAIRNLQSGQVGHMVAVVQLLLISVWGVPLALHLRRLYRLAAVPVSADRALFVRSKARRMWWWLGRDEFWGAMRYDALRCVEVTVLVALLAVGH